MGKKMLQKISTFSSYVWLLSVILFASIIALTTKFFTNDPSFSPGGKEQAWLLPMLGSIFLGFCAFAAMILFGLVGKIKKEGDKYNPPLRLTTWISTFLVVLIILAGGIFLFGVRQSNIGYKARDVSYTGQQLFDAINKYREENGRSRLILSDRICDNLVERQRVISSGNVGHKGFEDWVKKEGLSDEGWVVAEVYIKFTPTTQGAIDYWAGSPGHRVSLLNHSFTDGCAYANGDTGVAVFATKKYVEEKE